MVTDFFGLLLQELGKLLEVELQPDQLNSCTIKLQNEVVVQLEMDPTGEFFIIASQLGQIPPGKYREQVFLEALKADGMPYPLNGIFGYSKQADQLVLFEKMSIKNLDATKVAQLLAPFSEKAKIWKETITAGGTPSSVVGAAKPASGMFGLK